MSCSSLSRSIFCPGAIRHSSNHVSCHTHAFRVKRPVSFKNYYLCLLWIRNAKLLVNLYLGNFRIPTERKEFWLGTDRVTAKMDLNDITNIFSVFRNNYFSQNFYKNMCNSNTSSILKVFYRTVIKTFYYLISLLKIFFIVVAKMISFQ